MKLFAPLRQKLMEQLDVMREIEDEEILEIIDELIITESRSHYLTIREKEHLRRELFYSVRKLDVLQELLDDNSVTEIMVNGWQQIFYEKGGHIYPWKKTFTSEEKLNDVIGQIVSKCNRVINASSPIVDARLPTGDRVHAVIAPVALNGPILTIRRFSDTPVTLSRLIQLGSLTKEAADFLAMLVQARYTILIGGGTGCGKSTMLGALSAFIGPDERIITIEDNAELQIQGIENLVRLEAKPANTRDSPQISIRDLIKASLRMRPSRIVVGEVRLEEALDLLQACNTGHEGSMSTIHANSTQDMVSRLEMMVLMGLTLPLEAIRRQITSAFDIFIYLERMQDKSRKVLEIAEVRGWKDNEVQLAPLFFRNESGELIKGKPLYHVEKLKKEGIFHEERL